MKGVVPVLLLCLLAVTAVAHAHAELLTAVPAPGSTTTNALSEIRLTFSEPVSEESTIFLLGQNFQPVTGINAQPDAGNPHMLVTAVPPLPPGDYTVQWTAVSTDGHATSASYTFRVAAFAFSTTLFWQITLTLLFLGAFVILWRRNRHQ